MQVSALALLKMAMHANSGGNIEVMGILQGKIVKDTFVVLDVFALPVEGSETRVNAQAEAYEFMIDFLDSCKVSAMLLCYVAFQTRPYILPSERAASHTCREPEVTQVQVLELCKVLAACPCMPDPSRFTIQLLQEARTWANTFTTCRQWAA